MMSHRYHQPATRPPGGAYGRARALRLRLAAVALAAVLGTATAFGLSVHASHGAVAAAASHIATVVDVLDSGTGGPPMP